MARVVCSVTGGEKIAKYLQGWLPGSGAHAVKAGVLEDATGAGGKSVMDYAPIQEFGGSIPVTQKMRFFLGMTYGIWLGRAKTHITIPPRSFMRTTFAAKRKEWVSYLGKALKAGTPVATALEYVGIKMQDDIIQTIKSNLPPPNSAMTNKIKELVAPGALGKTLQMTGTLVHAIKYQLVDE